MRPFASILRTGRSPEGLWRRAAIGNGYGSECNLLRYLGRHRSRLDAAIMKTIPNVSSVRWVDFHFDPTCNWKDAERTALDFLDADHPARVAWTWAWPHRGTPITWDAVGAVKVGEQWEWLLIESKAHLDELSSSCGARETHGRPLIREALNRVKKALGVDENHDWLDGNYQHCNRIAVLHHLVTHAAPAHMLWIYFTGDWGNSRRTCPIDELGWREALAQQAESVGLPEKHLLSSRLHTLFLPVCPNT